MAGYLMLACLHCFACVVIIIMIMIDGYGISLVNFLSLVALFGASFFGYIPVVCFSPNTCCHK